MSYDEARDVWGAIVENPDFWAKDKHERMNIARQFGGDYTTRMGEEYLTERKDWDFLGGAMSIGSLIMNIPRKVAGSFGDLIAPEDPNEEGLSKRLREYGETPEEDQLTAEERSRKFIPLPELLSKSSALTLGGIEDASESTGFTAVSMLSGLAGGSLGAATGTGPVGATAGFLAASGAATYKMGKTAITQQVLDAAEAAKGSQLTDEETRYVLDATGELRTNHAVWEAGPESVGNLIAATGIGRIFKGAAKGATARFAGVMLGMYGSELTTESITRIGQSIVEEELGIGHGEKLSWTPDGAMKAIQDVGESVFVITTLLGGGSAAAGKVFGKKEVKPGEVVPEEDPMKDVERRLDIIRETPEVILEDKGVPIDSPTPKTPQEASAILEPPPLEPTPEERVLQERQARAQESPGDTTVLPDGSMRRDVPTLPEEVTQGATAVDPLNIQMDTLMGEAQELAAEQAGDLSRAAVVTEAINAGRIPDAELVGMYRELQVEALDIKRKRAIDKGMEKLSDDSNTLDGLEDLEERSKVIQRMKRTAKQIKAEMEFAKATGVLPRDIPGATTTVIPSREKKVTTAKQPATTPTAPTASTVVTEATPATSPTMPLESTIAPTPTEGTATVETKQGAPVQTQEQGKKKKVLEDGPEEVNGYTIRKSGVTTKGKQYVVTGKDGLEYAAGSVRAARDLAKKGLVEKTLRPYKVEGRGQAKGDKQEKLQEDQKTVVAEFIKKNEKEYQGPIKEYVSTAATELQAEGKELTLGTVRERAQKLLKRVENQKKGQSISRDTIEPGAEAATMGMGLESMTREDAEAVDPGIASVGLSGDTKVQEEAPVIEDAKEQEVAIAARAKEREAEWKKRNPGVNQNTLQKPDGQKDSLVFHTPDKVYRAESVVGENKRVYLNVFRGKEQVGTMLDNPEAAEALIKDHRDSTQLREAPVQAPKARTIVRRRVQDNLQGEQASTVDKLEKSGVVTQMTEADALQDLGVKDKKSFFIPPTSARAVMQYLAMEKAGKSREEIFKATGIWKGVDGQLRVETEVTGLNLDVDIQGSANIEQVVGQEFYQKYEGYLKDYVVVRSDKNKKAIAGTLLQKKEISLYDSFFELTPEQQQDVLVHELQHIIQFEHGMATGSSPLLAERKLKKVNEDTREELDDLLSATEDAILSQLMLDNGLTYEDINLVPTFNRWVRGKKGDQDLLKLQYEMQFMDQMEKNELFDSLTWKAREDASFVVHRDFYRRVAGEAEARLATRRFRMSPEQRAAEKPWETMERMLKEEGYWQGTEERTLLNPETMESYEVRFSKDGEIQGYTRPDGTVVLVPENIKGNEWGVVKHEVAVHARHLGKNDKTFQRILDSVWERDDAQVREAISMVPEDTNPMYVREEVLGYLIEYHPEVGIVREIIARVKSFLVDIGFSADLLSVKDLAAMAQIAVRGEQLTSSGSTRFSWSLGSFMGFKGIFSGGAKEGTLGPVDTTSKNFKKWFGKSVVQESGKPMRVKHASSASTIESFQVNSELGAHFGTAEQAAGIAQSRDGVGSTYDVYVSLENPLRLQDVGGFYPSRIVDQLVELGIIDRSQRDSIKKGSEFSSNAALKKAIEAKGYDGVIYLNRREGLSDEAFQSLGTPEELNRLSDKEFLKLMPEAKDSYIVFKPEQVKSALSNTGAFSRDDTRILYSKSKERKSPPKSRAEAQAILKGKSFKATTMDKIVDVRKTTEDFLRPVLDRIRVASEKIYGKLVQYETSMLSNQKRYSTLVKPFMEWHGKLGKEDQVTVDLALMNSHLKENRDFITSFIPKDIREKLEEALKDLNQRMLDVGIGGNKENPYYFPRRVKDMPRLMDVLHKQGMMGEALEAEKKRLGKPVLSPAEESEVLTKMFMTGRPYTLPRPGASKKRTVPWVDKETYQFYDNSTQSLLGHIFEMNEKLGAMEFIGRSDRKNQVAELRKEAEKLEAMKEGPERDALLQKYVQRAEALENTEQYLSDSLGAIVKEEMSDKPSSEQVEVIDMINARLRQKGAHGAIDHVRNIGYITTMGNFLSAITQLGDIPIIFYAHGLNMGSVKAVGTAFKNIGKVAWAELRGKEVPQDALVTQADFTNALREFSSGNSLTGQWVEKIFKISGLKYVDLVGKEAQMQAAQAKYKSGKNDKKFMERYESMFGDNTSKVLQEFKDGKRSQDTLTVLLAELSDWQPIFLSAQSKVYMTSGNGRLFYMLKTFTLRTTSAALREGMKDIKKGGALNVAKGVGKVAGIILLYAAAGAGTDEIKDVLRGRDDAFLDTTMDNFWQMFLVSRYSAQRGIQGDNLASQLLWSQAFPVRWADGLASDLWAIVDEDKELKLKTLQSTPFIGSIAYSRSGAGQTSYASMKKKDIMEMVRENRKDGKPPYTGDVKDAVKKHNERVKRDQWITNDTIMRAYKNG